MEFKKLVIDYVGERRRKFSMGSGCVIVNDGRVLLVRGRGKQMWKFPGGHVDDTETVRETVDRECEEEIGCEVELSGEPYLYMHIVEEDDLDILLIHYQAKIVSGEPVATTEIEEVGWFDVNHLSEGVAPNVTKALRYFEVY